MLTASLALSLLFLKLLVKSEVDLFQIPYGTAAPHPKPRSRGSGGGEGVGTERGPPLLSMCEEWRMPSAAGSFPLRVAPAVAAVAAAAAAAPPTPYTREVAGLDERP